jgi:hypothetical protein
MAPGPALEGSGGNRPDASVPVMYGNGQNGHTSGACRERAGAGAVSGMAIDLGRSPAGILELLAAALSPGGRVVGLAAGPAHVAMAGEHTARRRPAE